ncbi:hypothetical protein SESBI_29730 [Sesbania bispinosa]|nr:hypothetical protein SESBI_29730 [Sesbania bispinosa]
MERKHEYIRNKKRVRELKEKAAWRAMERRWRRGVMTVVMAAVHDGEGTRWWSERNGGAAS